MPGALELPPLQNYERIIYCNGMRVMCHSRIAQKDITDLVKLDKSAPVPLSNSAVDGHHESLGRLPDF